MTVTAKINAGWHPVYGEIVAGKQYEIPDGEPIPVELFETTKPVKESKK